MDQRKAEEDPRNQSHSPHHVRRVQPTTATGVAATPIWTSSANAAATTTTTTANAGSSAPSTQPTTTAWTTTTAAAAAEWSSTDLRANPEGARRELHDHPDDPRAAGSGQGARVHVLSAVAAPEPRLPSQLGRPISEYPTIVAGK